MMKYCKIVSFLVTCGLIYLPALKVSGQSVPEFDIKISKVWEQNERPLYNPSKIATLDGYLILIDDAKKEKVLIFNQESQQLIKTLGNEGRGPGEYLSPWNLFAFQNGEGRFCIYDLQIRKISCYNLNKIIGSSDLLPSFSFTLSGDSGIPLRVDGLPQANNFIITGIFAESYRFLLIDSTNHTLKKSHKINHKKGSEPLNVFQHAYTVLPASNFRGSKIAFAYFYTNIIEIYSDDGHLTDTFQGPGESFKPLFSVRKTPRGATMAQGGETRLAYIDVNSTRNYIFALFSGRKRKQRQAGHSKTIHVIDWNGKLRSIFHLDRDVSDCTVTLMEEKLFCIDKSGRIPSIVEYKIPVKY